MHTGDCFLLGYPHLSIMEKKEGDSKLVAVPVTVVVVIERFFTGDNVDESIYKEKKKPYYSKIISNTISL